MNTMKWLLRREFWEHKGGFFWAPVIGGSVFVLINIMVLIAGAAAAGRAHIQIGLIKLDDLMKNVDPQAMEVAGFAMDMTLLIIAALVALVSGIVVFFYSIGALYDERRDRSILFWKSLPLSDRETVISKALSATIVAPAIGIVAGVLTGILTFVVIGAFFAFNGQNVFGLMFTAAHPLQIGAFIMASLPIAALWSLPTVGWLMLCSVWARSKPFLWAAGMPLAAGIMVSWFDLMQTLAQPDTWFWKHVVSRLLFSVMPGSWMDFDKIEAAGDSPQAMAALFSLTEMYSTLGRLDLWIGAAAGIGMLALAIRMRRWRDEA